MKPTEDLMNDHAAISIVLSIMRKIAEDISSGKGCKYDEVESIIDFLQTFADKCHHGKEEQVLFPALEEAGISRDNGPVGVMLYEHTIGREFISQMIGAMHNKDGHSSRSDNELAESMVQYANLLSNHIMKENHILFPMADKVLDEEKQEEINKQFLNIEENVVGKGVHEKYHRLIHELEGKYLS